ncbi:hypothetical protein LAC81_07530 [Ensifer adhaerens]|uniref:hypothetical protein n=1 Tax=Ensifer adhaerens TaxID=106592 RepID=UPI001CBB5389|nr:hypothetical protein [Ensifer adhaerens]MBZ7921629.1 hypothetical protein [Ensifer adhaerens]UAX94048.1 hypothetical protein LAC78_07525 [Ensifer adhaerens]UAY01682.1 hypothetical protein LAC80_07530 [Ensifer adhaerens]UAY09066.1 hypothetical protein LAC81_07530 [Ensifer adhaerens]
MDDDNSDYLDEPDDCDCEDYDADILEGRARCFRCGRSWRMTTQQLSAETRWQASMFEASDADIA